MKIITWNINSARLRQASLEKLLQEQQPDVICLQEIKCQTELFPTEAFKACGYQYQHVCGMKAYNGVATLSKIPFKAIGSKDWCERADARHQYVELETGHKIHNFYVPAGGDVPDIETNEKFDHKLSFLQEMALFFQDQSPLTKQILVGDLNIAPLENDVWSHKQLLKVVSHTPIEVSALKEVRHAGNWQDAVRHVIPANERLYSWWSYRNRDWRASNRGRRLDHIWVSQDLISTIRHANIIMEMRDLEKPSDHAPVSVELEA